MPVRAVKTKKTKIVSFRISKEIYKFLEQCGLRQKNHLGNPMSASEAARSLFQKVLAETLPPPEDTAKGRGG